MRLLVPWLLIVAIAAAVRLPTLTAGLPYMTYVDEGHVLHQVVHLLAERTWKPTQYYYPSFPFYLIAATATAYSPLYAVSHGQPLREALSPSPPWYYDIVEPPELIVIGRLVTLAFSLAVVLLTGLLARRLAGNAAGLVAAWLAALVPALVARGVVVTVNPHVAFFTLATLLFAELVRDGGRPRRDAILAGAMTGLAAVCKYPAGLICLSVALAVLLSSVPWAEKLRRLFLAGTAAAMTTLIAMPPLALRLGDVTAFMKWTSKFYKDLASPSYWDQAVHRAEWDLPLDHPELGIVFLILATAGLIVAIRDRRWAKAIWGWLAFAVATGALLAPYSFRPFRNLLAFVPLACILVALLYTRIREKASRPLWVDLAAAVLPIVLFAPALNGYIRHHLVLEDSREQAIRWLAGHTGSNDKVLITEELAFLPSRIAFLGAGRVDIDTWDRVRDRVMNQRYRYLVLGELIRPNGKPKIPSGAVTRILRNYAVEATFGAYPTNSGAGVFKGNAQKIYILKRVKKKDPGVERLPTPDFQSKP